MNCTIHRDNSLDITCEALTLHLSPDQTEALYKFLRHRELETKPDCMWRVQFSTNECNYFVTNRNIDPSLITYFRNMDGLCFDCYGYEELEDVMNVILGMKAPKVGSRIPVLPLLDADDIIFENVMWPLINLDYASIDLSKLYAAAVNLHRHDKRIMVDIARGCRIIVKKFARDY